MTDPNLTELLERAGERTPVWPPPIQHIVAGARRTRRRRALMLTAATAAAIVATVGGTIVLSAFDSSSPDHPAPAASSLSHEPGTPTPPVTSTSTDLEGTWTVRALVGANGQSVLPDSARGKLQLSFANGKMTGTMGCNEVFGT